MGYMQKFLPSLWRLGSSACCLHILDTARGCFLGIFKKFSPTHTPLHAPLTFIANRDPKSTEVRPKIAFLQKFRLINFGRGGVSGARQFLIFLNYKYKLLFPKNISWPYGTWKVSPQNFQGWGTFSWEEVPPGNLG